MSRLPARLRSAADLAERAAVARQQAELTGAPTDPATIARLQLVADALIYAAEPLDPPPVASRAALIEAAIMTGTWVVSSAAVLLSVPNPAQPTTLAGTLVGCGVLATLIGQTVAALQRRREIRILPPVDDPGQVQGTIAELRIQLAEIMAALEPDRVGDHLEVGRRVDMALVWLDAAEQAQLETPGRHTDAGWPPEVHPSARP
jgi:hypothetical protein